MSFTTAESTQFPLKQFSSEVYAQSCEPIELQYDIEYGNVESTCYDKETVSLLMEITSIGSSKIIVHLPKTMIFSLDQECNSAGEIMVLLNEEEIDSSRLTISETSSERIATLILPRDSTTLNLLELLH